MPLFLGIIWSIQKKVVPLHAFSRRVNVHAHDVRSAGGEN